MLLIWWHHVVPLLRSEKEVRLSWYIYVLSYLSISTLLLNFSKMQMAFFETFLLSLGRQNNFLGCFGFSPGRKQMNIIAAWNFLSKASVPIHIAVLDLLIIPNFWRIRRTCLSSFLVGSVFFSWEKIDADSIFEFDSGVFGYIVYAFYIWFLYNTFVELVKSWHRFG